MPSREVVHIFLGSPGDVPTERSLAKEVVDQVNQHLASKFEIQLELFGWEQQPPGFGRPQELINPHVDEAELFIGLLWRRWGTPSGEEHSSGFHEEYRRACDRRSETQSVPDVWLFFKDVEEEQRNDPGPELQKVLDFRDRVEREREALFHSFADEGEWKEKLFRLLVGWVSERARLALTAEEPTGTSSGGGEVQDPPDQATSSDADEAVSELAAALQEAAQVMESHGGAKYPETETAARILLASFQWLSDRTTNEVLGTHESNVMYRLRDTLTPTVSERITLIRSMLTGDDLRPGWFWLRDAVEPAAILANLAAHDRNSAVRYQAIVALGDLSVLEILDSQFSEMRPSAVLPTLLDDEDSAVRNVAMDAAAAHASTEAFELLMQADRPYAKPSLVRALLNRSPNAALDFVLREERRLALVVEEDLEAHADDYDPELLSAMQGSDEAVVREIGLKLSAASGQLQQSDAEEAMTDPAPFVRRTALDLVQEAGWVIDQTTFESAMEGYVYGDSKEEERRHARQLLTRTEAELRESANWYLARGHHAYQALATKHAGEYLSRAARDLDDGFLQFQDESRVALDQRFGEGSAEELGERKTVALDFTLAALDGLRAHASPDHMPVVARLVDEGDAQIQLAALRVIASVDPKTAAERAATLALDGNWGNADARVAAARIAVATPSSGVALDLASSSDPAVARVAIPHIGSHDEGEARLRGLLGAEDDGVRVAALRTIVSSTTADEELADLLTEYLAAGGYYYYNVVTWLDRLVFSPEPFRSRYRAALLTD